MAVIKILAFAGSAHLTSVNKKIVNVAAQGARAAGAEVTVIDLLDYPLPIFNEDMEAKDGAPANVAKLKELFKSHPGFLIACPEYNSSVTPLLKNTIDWLSRKAQGETSMVAFEGKVIVLMAASPGGLGGLRGLAHVRDIFGNIGAIVLPQQVALAKAKDAFNDDGSIKDLAKDASIRKLGADLAAFLTKIVP